MASRPRKVPCYLSYSCCSWFPSIDRERMDHLHSNHTTAFDSGERLPYVSLRATQAQTCFEMLRHTHSDASLGTASSKATRRQEPRSTKR
jgi:hypothetical protein